MARCDRPPGRSKKATDGHEAAKRHTKDDVDGTKACATVAQYARHILETHTKHYANTGAWRTFRLGLTQATGSRQFRLHYRAVISNAADEAISA